MTGEECHVVVVLMKSMRSQYGGMHWKIFFQLYTHQRIQHDLSYKLVAIDAAVNDERTRDDRVMCSAPCQTLNFQWDLESSCDDMVFNRGNPFRLQFLGKGAHASMNNSLMPLR